VIVFAVTLQRPLLAACGLLVGAVLTTAASWPGLRREETTTAATSGDGSVRAGLSFTAIEATFVAYFALDGAMIAAMRPAVDAGMYRVAYAFVIAAAVVPVALNADVLRVRLWQLSGERRAQALRKAIWLTAIAAVTVTLCFELLGGFGERLFFGPKFAAAIPIIHILGLAMPFHYANSVASNLLVGQGRMRTVLRVQGVMLLVNIAGNVWLIPSHGPRGAAIATVATEALGLVVYLVVLRRSRLLADSGTTLAS
jgi:O-antigen/teichoic acid export membrane protein